MMTNIKIKRSNMFFFLKRLGQTIWYTVVWLRDTFSIIPGLWKVFKLSAPRVTFFGGAKLKLENPYAKAATELALLLVNSNFSIITGGGAGIMEAAARGARIKNKKRTTNLGIGVSKLEEGAIPQAHGSFVRVKNFVLRKWLMMQFSAAYIVFPGGVGTYDELAEILTLMDTGMLRRYPIILYGREYWGKLEVWVNDGLMRGYIHPHVKDFFVIADNVESAYQHICKSCSRRGFKMKL
jgi:uncharacterized protein (TIGR00730 family)